MGWIIPAASLAYGIYNSESAKSKASKAASQANNVTPVDINAVQNQALAASQQNAAASNALEQQYNPYLNSLRQSSTAGLNQYLTPSANDNTLTQGYMNAFNNASNGPLAANPALSGAATAAQQQLALGGNLDQETQNQIMRAGAAHAGTLGGPGGNLGLGRDISARDLGLTSLQLQNSRMQNAANIGGQASNYGLQALAQQQQALQGYGSAASNLGQQQYGRNLSIAGMTQGIQQPQSGLSPSSVAGISVGNTNMQNSANQNAAAIAAQGANSQGALGGQLMGYGLGALAQNGGNIFGAAGSGAGGGTPGLSNYYGSAGIGAPTTAANFFAPTTPQIGYTAPTNWGS